VTYAVLLEEIGCGAKVSRRAGGAHGGSAGGETPQSVDWTAGESERSAAYSERVAGRKNEFGVAYETFQINQLFYVPWLQLKIEAICFLPTMSRRTSCRE